MNNTQHPTINVRRLARLRARARLHDVLIRKARGRPHANNHGELMLVSCYGNAVVAGSNFDLTLGEAEALIDGWSRT